MAPREPVTILPIDKTSYAMVKSNERAWCLHEPTLSDIRQRQRMPQYLIFHSILSVNIECCVWWISISIACSRYYGSCWTFPEVCKQLSTHHAKINCWTTSTIFIALTVYARVEALFRLNGRTGERTMEHASTSRTRPSQNHNITHIRSKKPSLHAWPFSLSRAMNPQFTIPNAPTSMQIIIYSNMVSKRKSNDRRITIFFSVRCVFFGLLVADDLFATPHNAVSGWMPKPTILTEINSNSTGSCTLLLSQSQLSRPPVSVICPTILFNKHQYHNIQCSRIQARRAGWVWLTHAINPCQTDQRSSVCSVCCVSVHCQNRSSLLHGHFTSEWIWL